VTRPFPDHIRTFLDDERFATISTLDPDGTPFPAVVWYRVDGDEVVLNSAIGRRWPTNLLRDPRMSFAVIDAADGYRWVGLIGTVEAIFDRETTQADIAEMARRYDADDPDEAERQITEQFERQDRVSFRFRAHSIQDHLD
jgi:PPOX class probable F420-dependent enzyme